MSMSAEFAQPGRDPERHRPPSETTISAVPETLSQQPATAGSVPSIGVLQQRANGEMRTQVMRRAQQNSGNLKAQQLVAQLRSSAAIQRQCACGGICSSCSGKGVSDAPVSLQRSASSLGAAGGTVNADIIPADSPGQPLERSTRDFMEPRLGSDFSDVRVHHDTRAARSADLLGADAYTIGRDIYFAAGKYAPGTRDGQHLLAHELTHAIQQGNVSMPGGGGAQMRSVGVGATDSPLEQEAELAADSVMSSPEKVPTVSADSQPAVRRSWLGDAWDATGGRAVNFVEDKVGDAIDAAEDWIVSKVEKYAPGLLDLLRLGVVDFLKERISAGFDGIFGGLTSLVQKDGFIGGAAGVIEQHATSLGKAASGLLTGACESFAHVAAIASEFAQGIAGSALEGIRIVASAVGGFLSTLWNNLVAPVWDAIKAIGGAVWTWIEDKARWIWEKTAPIRNTLSRVWHWILKKFGVVWDSGTGVFDWLKEKAKAAWDKVYEFTKPIHGPLKLIGEVLLLMSGIGPIIAIWKGAPVLWDALKWLYSHWKSTDFIVLGRKALTEHILPAISSGAQTVASLIESAADWITDKIDSIDAALGGLLKTMGVSVLLSLARRAVQFVADAFRRFAVWIKTGFIKVLIKLKDVLLSIWNFIKPVLAFLLKLVIVVSNPLLLPVVITGYVWRLLPDCFKPPIIDFVLDLLITVVRALPTFKILGDAWPPAKFKILGALSEARVSSPEKKIEASNRTARIMTGDDLEWVGNLLSAMMKVPDYLEGQFEEELLGMDLTEPLPFERGAPPLDGAADGSAGAAGAAGLGGMDGLGGGAMSPEDAKVLSSSSLSADQIGVDHIADLQLEPELIADLEAHGGEKEFRGPSDPSRTVKGIQAELNGAAVAGADPSTGMASATGASPTTGAGPSTDEQLEAFMNQPAPDGCTKEQPAKQETATAIPENMKIGPLTRGQRARYLLHQIGQGVKTWFGCNASWLVPSIIGVIALLIGVEILTGGAVTAALPAILDIMGTIMIGVAAARAAGYVAEYVAKAVSGDLVGASKSLARGLAIVAIDLVFALLFNLDKVIKTLKQGLKATAETVAKAAKAAVKDTIESVEELGRIGSKGIKTAGRNIAGFGKAIVKNGKLLLEGVGEGFAKGIKKVEELFERLWKKLRFKAFRLRLSGGWFELEGEINPWVMIARGKIQWIEDRDVIEGGNKLGEKTVGKVAGKKVEGIFVGGSRELPNYTKIADLYIEEGISETHVIHHAFEQQAFKNFPELFTLEEIHAGPNLRAIRRGVFNSRVHLSKIRVLWNDFYNEIREAKLLGSTARKAFDDFRGYVDGYIKSMNLFVETNAAVIKAIEAGDKATARALLDAESNRYLSKARQAVLKAVGK
jgi:Domain of unknown function (DUF4157)